MKNKFNKTEKRTCKFYDWGKCKIRINGKDCRPITKIETFPESISECKGFEPIEAGEKRKQ